MWDVRVGFFFFLRSFDVRINFSLSLSAHTAETAEELNVVYNTSSLPLNHVVDQTLLYGLTRMRCGTRLFESAPSLVTENNPPLFLVPAPSGIVPQFPLLSLLEPWL